MTESGNTCATLASQTSCSLTYTPGSTAVSQTSFPIQGNNTNVITAAIQINSDVTLNSVSPSSGPTSGGTGVIISGNGLTDTTGVTFAGVDATSVNVVNSTTVTAVTPAHAAGAVDVELTTSTGSSTLLNGYTYVTTSVGQSAFGGTIACLNGGLNNLIAATADNSIGILWNNSSSIAGATSTTDGAGNTSAIVSAGGITPNAATLCDNYEVDSQGNTPCESGNTCYNDWFLPAGNNLTSSGQLNCLYTNQSSIGGFSSGIYWSSTQATISNAHAQSFAVGTQVSLNKSTLSFVRCVRGFTP